MRKVIFEIDNMSPICHGMNDSNYVYIQAIESNGSIFFLESAYRGSGSRTEKKYHQFSYYFEEDIENLSNDEFREVVENDLYINKNWNFYMKDEDLCRKHFAKIFNDEEIKFI